MNAIEEFEIYKALKNNNDDGKILDTQLNCPSNSHCTILT